MRAHGPSRKSTSRTGTADPQDPRRGSQSRIRDCAVHRRDFLGAPPRRGRIPLSRAPSSRQGGIDRCRVDRDLEWPAGAGVSPHQAGSEASEGNRRELGHADRRREESAAMGVKSRWFRRRPSDDEMREELEAHVAMRAEHDRVDEATARRRVGNLLQTREGMRRVWIAEWWDALRQDAHFTWRSWWRHPGFALSAILVLGLGLGASTALFAALDRVLFKPLPYADPDRLVSVGLVTLARVMAVFGPAYRAAHVDPVAALRAD